MRALGLLVSSVTILLPCDELRGHDVVAVRLNGVHDGLYYLIACDNR